LSSQRLQTILRASLVDNRTDLDYPGGTGLTLDGLGNVTVRKDRNESETSYTYDELGRRIVLE